MHMLYDTTTVHPLDRYEYYRAASAVELAPVSVHGRSPGRLLTKMSVADIGDFEVEVHTWVADGEVLTRRTGRLIRVCDPECYRILLGVTPGLRLEHADHRVAVGAGDIVLGDTSRPWTATLPTGSRPMRVVMLTFPRALAPIDGAIIGPLVGTLMPRSLPARSLIAQFLIDLTEPGATHSPGLADLLRDCAVGLIRQRLGEPTEITKHTCRLLRQTRIDGIVRRCLGNPALNPEEIARAANISPRYLYALLHDTDLTPMQLLKQRRLHEAHRRLQDPALAGTSIKDLMTAVGYRRADQFARDFRQQFGVSPRQARRPASDRSS